MTCERCFFRYDETSMRGNVCNLCFENNNRKRMSMWGGVNYYVQPIESNGDKLDAHNYMLDAQNKVTDLLTDFIKDKRFGLLHKSFIIIFINSYINLNKI